MHNGMQSILDELQRCQDERLEVNTLCDSCLKGFLVVVLYCCYILEWKDRFELGHGTMISQLCIPYLVTREEYGSMEDATRKDMEGTVRVEETFWNIMNKISGIQVTKY